MDWKFEKWIPGEGECELTWDKITNEYEEIEYDMEKKEYIKPKMEEIDLSNQELILCGSGEDDGWDGDFGSIKNPTDIASV